MMIITDLDDNDDMANPYNIDSRSDDMDDDLDEEDDEVYWSVWGMHNFSTLYSLIESCDINIEFYWY